MLSAYIELSYADVLLSDGRGRVGYLLKDRVTSLDVLVESLKTIVAGGTVLDPEVVAQLLVARRADPLDALSPREKDVLGLMAEGRSNAAIASQLVVSAGAVEKHMSNIFAKINLPELGSDNRRVLAVLAWLRSRWCQRVIRNLRTLKPGSLSVRHHAHPWSCHPDRTCGQSVGRPRPSGRTGRRPVRRDGDGDRSGRGSRGDDLLGSDESHGWSRSFPSSR